MKTVLKSVYVTVPFHGAAPRAIPWTTCEHELLQDSQIILQPRHRGTKMSVCLSEEKLI